MGKYTVSLPARSDESVPLPLGCTNASGTPVALQTGEKALAAAKMLAAKKQKKAMEVAMSPGKALGMTAFMMYMSGSQLNIFTITTVSGALLNPIRGLFAMNATFRNFEDPDGHTSLLQPKLVFVGMQLVALAVGLYKMSTMGLLPTTAADFMDSIQFKENVESVGQPI